MAVKPGAHLCTIAEQIIEDGATGLTIQFAYVEGSTAPYRLRLYGTDAGHMREIAFDEEGKEAAAGTALSGDCRPSWLRTVK